MIACIVMLLPPLIADCWIVKPVIVVPDRAEQRIFASLAPLTPGFEYNDLQVKFIICAAVSKKKHYLLQRPLVY